MYNISETKIKCPLTPWKIDCKERIKKIQKAKNVGRKTVAYLYPRLDSSTFRYRGYNTSETLEYSMFWTGTWFEVFDELEEFSNNVDLFDVIILIRCAYVIGMKELINEAHRKRIPVLYDVDDLVYSPKRIDYLLESLEIKYETDLNYWYGLTARNEEIIKRCDGVIVTNDYLGKMVMEDEKLPVYIVPNYLNNIQEIISNEYYEQKINLQPSKPFEIGYFSGSNTHRKDLMSCMPEIEEFLLNHDDAALRIVGYMELPDRFVKYVKNKKILFSSFKSFTTLQYEQAKVDVAIMPLIDNPFTNCKSELKFFETAIVGTVSCASPTYAFDKAIEDGVNGYICTKDKWYDAINEIYEGTRLKEMRVAARNTALKKYGNAEQLFNLQRVLNDIYGLRCV